MEVKLVHTSVQMFTPDEIYMEAAAFTPKGGNKMVTLDLSLVVLASPLTREEGRRVCCGIYFGDQKG